MPAAYQQVLTTLGKTGDYHRRRRQDADVFGFGGWLAMTKGTGGLDVMMADLVLTQDEVNPVMSALLDNGLDVTALHNHFMWEEPRIFYMHVHSRGTPADLARKVKPGV